jgi:ribonuclease III
MNCAERLPKFLLSVHWQVNDFKLYEQALTHSSYAHERGHRCEHNERLEFLGDAVLELIISDYLYHHYPHLPEGKLTRLRAALVCEASLAQLAYTLELGQYLRLGKGEAVGGGASRPALLADTVEALIGALYLDLGLSQCRDYVLALYSPVLEELRKGEGVLRQDYKTLLQEFAQARFSVTPEYRVIRESGPDHNKVFESEVLLSSRPVGRGEGHSKKEAEQAAAKEAWCELT